MKTVSHERDALTGIILCTLDFDRERRSYSIEELVIFLRDALCFRIFSYTEIGVRLLIADLLESGKLDMRSDGTLSIPACDPDTRVEKFCGAWFAINEGRITGPFQTEGEANDAIEVHTNSEDGSVGRG